MPSKRQPSKQRRAAQNRATRVQRETRAQRAGELRASATERVVDVGDEPAGGSRPARPAGGLLGSLFARGGQAGGGSSSSSPAESPSPPPGGGSGLIATAADGTRLPGAFATFISFVLSGAFFVLLMVLPIVQVDDRGEELPYTFRGVYLEARRILSESSSPIDAETVTTVDAFGGLAVLVALAGPLVAGLAWWSHRRTARSTPLTVGMLVFAAMVFLFPRLGTQYFIPALIFMAVGSFQARKAEMPARMAERAARQGRGRGRPADEGDGDGDEVIDVDSIEADEEYDEDEYDDEYEDVEGEYDDDEYEDEDEDLDEDAEYDEEDEYEDEEDVEDEDLDEDAEYDEEDEYEDVEDEDLDEVDEDVDEEPAEDVAPTGRRRWRRR